MGKRSQLYAMLGAMLHCLRIFDDRASTRVLLGAFVLLMTGACGRSGASPNDPGSPPHKGEEPLVCTQIGCLDGFRIAIEPESGLAAGAYVFAIEIDGEVTTCQGSLPLGPCGLDPSVICSSDAVTVGESGCAMAPGDQGFGELLFQGHPKRVKVTIQRDGEVLSDEEFAPQYRHLQPNGPACEPICEQAEAQLKLRATD